VSEIKHDITKNKTVSYNNTISLPVNIIFYLIVSRCNFLSIFFFRLLVLTLKMNDKIKVKVLLQCY